MTDTTTSETSKQKTIFLAVLLFGGFTLLLIFYLIYKYFRMRRNDLRQQERIRMHNQEQRSRIQKKQQENLPERVLTDSILNFSNTVNLDDRNHLGCRNCSGPLNSTRSHTVTDPSDSFMAYTSPNKDGPHSNFLCNNCQDGCLWNKTMDTVAKKKKPNKNKISIKANINFHKNNNSKEKKDNNPYNNESVSLHFSYQQFDSDNEGIIFLF